MALMAVAGRDVVFTPTMGAFLEPETIIALPGLWPVLSGFFRGGQQALAATAIVLDHLAPGVGFTPENIGKTTGRAEHLYRLTVRIRPALTDFGVVQIHTVTRVINHQAIAFAFAQAQAPANDLLIQADRLGGPQNRNKVHVGCIKTGGED